MKKKLILARSAMVISLQCFLCITWILLCVSCCFQDEARVQKVTKRINTLEEVTINVKLLSEMLSHYNKDSSSDSDKEILKVSTHTHESLLLCIILAQQQ